MSIKDSDYPYFEKLFGVNRKKIKTAEAWDAADRFFEFHYKVFKEKLSDTELKKIKSRSLLFLHELATTNNIYSEPYKKIELLIKKIDDSLTTGTNAKPSQKIDDYFTGEKSLTSELKNFILLTYKKPKPKLALQLLFAASDIGLFQNPKNIDQTELAAALSEFFNKPFTQQNISYNIPKLFAAKRRDHDRIELLRNFINKYLEK